MQTKICTACNEEKSLEQFPPRKDAPNATHRSRCKSCHYKITRDRYLPQLRMAQSVWKKNNRKRVNETAKANRLANPVPYKLASAKWLKNNPEKHRQLVRARDARIIGATPQWANKQKILEVYKAAVDLTKSTGIRHDVDHIIPLRNPLVCGLHVENNLQVLTGVENSRKNNNFYISE